MATITRSIDIDVEPGVAWEALADFGALHERLVRGFVVAAALDGPDIRTVTFFNGAVARERLVGIDPDGRRLSYTLIESRLNPTHHNGSAQVFDLGRGRCRFVWITDVLPDAVASDMAQMMDAGIVRIKETLEQSYPPR